ncbi:hypothetical protein [Aminobacter sp. LjRoot7]|uniref:hypothetical protein n=1 Tax=Aminobacter sp. LjRoot7 TaxID=3342335 RepID=UPI003ECFD161
MFIGTCAGAVPLANMSEGNFSTTQEAFAGSLLATPSIAEDLDWKAFCFKLADQVLFFTTSLRLVGSETTDAKVSNGSVQL